MTSTELVALEVRVSKNFDFLQDQQNDPRYPGWLAAWIALLDQYTIYLTTQGLTAAPGGMWDKREERV